MTSTENLPKKKSHLKYMKSENIQISREVIETYKEYNLKIFPVNIIWDEKKKKKEDIVPPPNWNNLSIEQSYNLFDEWEEDNLFNAWQNDNLFHEWTDRR